jgi:CemA family
MYPKKYLRRVRRVPRSVEPIGIIPRSLIRALGRFLTQLFQTSNVAVMDEFRLSRYQIIVSVQSFLTLIFAPLIANHLATTFILLPVTNYLWNGQQGDIFLNQHYEQQALEKLEHFEEELYFEYMISPDKYETPIWASYQIEAGQPFPMVFKSTIQRKTVDLAHEYNTKSITALTNFFGDVVTVATIGFVLITFRAQFIIFRSFLIEFIYSLSDTMKSVLLILSTNLLVGFHSPRGWELLMETLLERFGFPPNENFVFLFVASFPVLLDTVFKYWIFRYLNKISPSTVATYHAMIE